MGEAHMGEAHTGEAHTGEARRDFTKQWVKVQRKTGTFSLTAKRVLVKFFGVCIGNAYIF
jgi:hypothetical protein